MGSIDGFSSLVNLSELIQKNSISTFVETGCHLGHSLSTAIGLDVSNLYSCDIDEHYVNICRDRFKHNDRVHIEHCSSYDFLAKILPSLDKQDSVLFFLDAHLPDSDSLIDFSLPLEEELDLIWKFRSKKKDFIIIDDLRIYEDNNYTGGNWVDRSKYGTPTLDFLKKYNYNVEKFLQHEGYIYLTNNIVV